MRIWLLAVGLLGNGGVAEGIDNGLGLGKRLGVLGFVRMSVGVLENF